MSPEPILAALPLIGSLSGPAAAVLAIATLVFIHEFGHFIVAKMCGVAVTTFSLGFGRRLVGFEYKGTDYRISMIPFGGYVALAGADPFSYDEDIDQQLEDPEMAFHRRPVWQRLLVIGAGPAMNLVLPVIVFTALLMAGEPRPSNEVGTVGADGVAAEAGLLPGDHIVGVGTQSGLRTFGEVGEALLALGEGTHPVTVERDGQTLELPFTLPEGGVKEARVGLSSTRASAKVGIDDPRSPAGRAGLETGDTIASVDGAAVRDWLELEQALSVAAPRLALTVESPDGDVRSITVTSDPAWAALSATPPGAAAQRWGVLPSSLFVASVSPSVTPPDDGFFAGCGPTPSEAPPPSPAEQAGIAQGDRFLRIDGQPVLLWSDVLRLVSATMEGEGEGATARPVDIEMVRAGEVVSLTMTPEVIEDTDQMARYYRRPVIGVVSLGGYVSGPDVRVRYGFVPAVTRATEETIASARFVLDTLASMVTREVDMKQSVGGPVEIFRQASQAAERGIFDYARLLAMLSISLGIVNLLPVPVLDGGQLLFFLLEAIRGRPVSVTLRERAQQLGVLFMVLLMLTVLVWDIQRALGSG